MKLELEIFGSLCATRVFRINDVEANSCDFGEQGDEDAENAEDYACGNMQFVSSGPTKEIMEKYSITESEYREVSKKLTEGLSFGCCGCCV